MSNAQWRPPMCGPYFNPFAINSAQPTKSRAVEAYREASEQIVAADYEEARLQLDLAHRGLPRIKDRIALQIARLELLRNHPERAAEFFVEAEGSPHESVRLEAASGRVLSLLRADDPAADQALEDLLLAYPSIPGGAELRLEQAQSLMRRGRIVESIATLHAIRTDWPGSRAAGSAEVELARLKARGHQTPSMSDEERVQRARLLVRTGPLDEAKSLIAELLESPLTGPQHADVHYLAARLARDEGRWTAAETYLRTAQLFPIENLATARHIENRANDMAETANSRDLDYARLRLSNLRAGRSDVSIPTNQIIDMIQVASGAGFRAEVDALLISLSKRLGTPPSAVFDATMAAAGTGSEELIIGLLENVAKRPGSRYRVVALYHLARALERAGRPAQAAPLFAQAQADATLTGDAYYALWAGNGLERVQHGRKSEGKEGLSNGADGPVPRAPRTSGRALAKQLRPVAERHSETFPWIARAVDLLRVGELDAASAELFQAYLTWRHALGKPVARAGLNSVARANNRIHEVLPSEVRTARIALSLEDRTTLSTVAAMLGDMGTAGGFAGPEFIETRPRAYEWLAIPAARRYGLDPNLLLAVMRVESAYQKHIVSYAGAVGLMQIMPRTGQLIAHALGRDDFSPADLLDPGLNLEFAAWYLSSLIRRFDGRLPLAIAAYNGGPHNVRRWIQEGAEGAPLDVMLERIPFTQTHRYVRKVLVHYSAYRQQRELPMPQLSVQLPEQRVDPLAF
ncbi:MAG: transglycosylase SLT domain-containing protein [Polyangiales bacterium]